MTSTKNTTATFITEGLLYLHIQNKYAASKVKTVSTNAIPFLVPGNGILKEWTPCPGFPKMSLYAQTIT